MAGYTKQFNSLPGDKIDANLFDTEYQLVDDAFDGATGHTHSGAADDGAFVPMIADELNLNSIAVDGNTNTISFNINVGGTNTEQFIIQEQAIVPSVVFNLGAPGTEFGDAYFNGMVQTGTLKFASNFFVNDIYNEPDMISDSATALVTQQSVKAFVEDSIVSAPGIFIQSVYNERITDFALSGSLAPYLTVEITVQEGSYVNIHSHITAKGETFAGSVVGGIYRDTTMIHDETFYIVQSDDVPFFGNAGRVDRDGPLPAGTYEYVIRAREALTNGTALFASLLVIEESA